MRSCIAVIVLTLLTTTKAVNRELAFGFPQPQPVEDIVIPVVLEQIGFQESRNCWNAVNLNKNGTRDWGRFQMNDVAFKELLIKKGIPEPNREQFLLDTLMQKRYALALLTHNDSILKSRKRKINKSNQIKAWAVSAYNI